MFQLTLHRRLSSGNFPSIAFRSQLDWYLTPITSSDLHVETNMSDADEANHSRLADENLCTKFRILQLMIPKKVYHNFSQRLFFYHTLCG